MPNASAGALASPLPLRSQRAQDRATAARPAFADALTYAFDIAFRAPESLSLAQRAAYGLERPRSYHEPRHVGRRAQLDERNAPNVARRAQLGEYVAPNVSRRAQLRECSAPNVARGAQLGDPRPGETPRPPRSTMKVDRSATDVAHPYFRFNARAGSAEITFVVANGRAFAGVRSWNR